MNWHLKTEIPEADFAKNSSPENILKLYRGFFSSFYQFRTHSYFF